MAEKKLQSAKSPREGFFDREEAEDALELLFQFANHFQWTKAFAQIQPLLKAAPGIKQAVTIYRNTLLSVQEGLRDGVTTRQSASADLLRANIELKEAYSNYTEKLDSNDRNATPAEKWLLLDIDNTSNPLKVYDRNMNEIQTRINREGVFSGFVPILPIVSPQLDPAKLKKKGIPSNSYAGYTILEKQFIAGISHEYIRTNLNLPAKGVPSEKQTKLVVDEFRDLLLAKYRSRRFVEMSSPASWWGAQWLWFSTNTEYNVLKECTIVPNAVSSLKIKSWSFPFSTRG